MSEDITFDFGLGFESIAERVATERAERAAMLGSVISYEIGFLDDFLRGIRPHDLILVGASTGVGKTEFATQIARLNAAKGKRVHYFALEAEPKEIERRIKHSIVNELTNGPKGSYADWFLGRWQPDIGVEQKAEAAMRDSLSTLFTYYRGSSFKPQDIRRLFSAIQLETDLIILDHVHYVDNEDQNENRGLKTTVQLIRDVALGLGKPVILIGHLRKRDIKTRGIVPDIDDFHGSSDLTKICTQVITLAPARDMSHNGLSGTYISAQKNRFGGASGHVALCWFDPFRKRYVDRYTLGFPSVDGKEFSIVAPDKVPAWARRAVQ